MTTATQNPEAPAPAPAEIAKLPYATRYRTHTCGELRKEHAGKEAKLCGSVDKVVDPLSFELRDGYGRTRIRLGPKAQEGAKEFMGKTEPALEHVVLVSGKVVPRAKADKENPTGEVELEASSFEVLSFSRSPIIFDFHDDALPREDRIRHRYVYMRKPAVHEAFAFRTRVQQEVRRFLLGKSFDEVETPLLANRWSPEQTEAFFCIRGRKEIFALPGKRTIHGPVLMTSGFDRTFEFSRRFARRQAYGPWQQAEYTVLELMMAYIDELDLHKLEDELLARVWKAALGEDLPTPIPEYTWEDALIQFGSDCPDLRNSIGFQDVTRVAAQAKVPEIRKLLLAGGAIRATVLPKAGPQLKEEQLPELGKCAGEAKHSTLGWIRPTAEGLDSKFFQSKDVKVPGFGLHKLPGYEVSELGPLDEALARDIVKAVAGKQGDMVVVVIAPDRGSASAISASARRFIAEALALGTKKWAPVRITKLPFFRYDNEKGDWVLHGDPLTRPVEEEIEGDPHQIHGLGHYLVLNGVNIGGGSVRNHNLFLQQNMLKLFGYGPTQIDERFSQYLWTMRFGVPPHGRIGIGMDRLVALLKGFQSIDEVIPMPKTEDGKDPLTRSPWPIDPHVVSGLFGL